MTPMQAQYRAIKKKYKTEILFFRLGDFYEMFFDDALKASKILDITLTSRGVANHKNKEKADKIPMCGVPFHSADKYIKKLVENGESVAICEQQGDPSQTKGIVERKVVKVITPGTILDDNNLSNNNYLMCFFDSTKGQIITWMDFSIGEINYFFNKKEELQKTLFDSNLEKVNKEDFNIEKYLPKENILEVVVADNQKNLIKDLNLNPHTKITKMPSWYFEKDFAITNFKNHFKTSSLKGFELDKKEEVAIVLGVLIRYLEETQTGSLIHINSIKDVSLKKHMILDEKTVKHLELINNNYDGTKERTLLSILDKTKNTMGKRLLQKWIYQPLVEKKSIEERLDSVSYFADNKNVAISIQQILSEIIDLEKISSKIGTFSVNPKELVSLKHSLLQIPEIKGILNNKQEKIPFLIENIRKNIRDFQEFISILNETFKEEPSVDIKNGRFIRDGFNKELDDLRRISTGGKDWILKLQQEERKRTNIDNLKIKFNKVFGYYIEISKAHLNSIKIPKDYERKQTLVNAERFITPELKEMEAKVLGAEERINKLELNLFEDFLEKAQRFISNLQQTAKSLSQLDCLLSFSQVAYENKYKRPILSLAKRDLIIKKGRHPVIENILEEDDFVDNDLKMREEIKMIILTGPNMSGKSTYLRQNALIILMSHIGSFVPAKEAIIPITDRIFTRIGASDNLSEGESTFMVEMTETANILNNATKRSFVILDEIGRGTSTYDGLSIAWAVVEYLLEKVKAKTLFATHYHELIQMEEEKEGVLNFNIKVVEDGNRVVFLHKIKEGGTDKSYGLEVARLAGIPKEVIKKGEQKLKEFEKKRD